MNLKELQIKRAYDSDGVNILREFYIPALSCATQYKRLTGFFSSGILSAAAQGILGLIENGGRMQLIVGATLHRDDLAIAEDVQNNPEKYIEKALLDELGAISDMLVNDHLEALGWMLANNLLEIRIGIVNHGGLFHMKVGIIEDAFGNKISFSGSDNETPSGWRHNIEEFKVFRAWFPEENEYFNSDEDKFERFWEGRATKVKTVPLPEAVKSRLINIAPKKKENLRIWKDKQLTNSKTHSNYTKEPRSVNLRPHQLNAIKALESHAGTGILAMATGSGKTITALSYARMVSINEPLCTVIAVPYIHLVKQWIDNDIRPMFPDVPIVEVHGQSNWRTQLPLYLSSFSLGVFKHIFIVGLYGSLADPDFVKILDNSKIKPSNILLIADEVHNSGAIDARNGLVENYGRRVGLSATPERYFDEEGTDVVKNFFGGIIYEYNLSQAIADGFLTPYNYFPVIVRLSEDEYRKYEEISAKILRSYAITKSSESDIFNRSDVKKLLIQRSRLIKGAINKIPAVSSLLSEINEQGVTNTLIYCDGLNQLDKVQSILNKLGIVNHKFTQTEKLELREIILNNFATGIYKALVAVKCLDEGVDVPATRVAIILASTSNPREFIQRRGRVLRKDITKKEATIYDFVIVPPSNSANRIGKLEKSILQSEFKRVRDFIETARNKADIYRQFLVIMEEFGVYL